MTNSFTIHFAGANTHCVLHERIARALNFPSYYGHNLAALFDCLTDISEPTSIVLQLNTAPDKDMATYQQKVLRVFRDAQEANDMLTVCIEDKTVR